MQITPITPYDQAFHINASVKPQVASTDEVSFADLLARMQEKLPAEHENECCQNFDFSLLVEWIVFMMLFSSSTSGDTDLPSLAFFPGLSGTNNS